MAASRTILRMCWSWSSSFTIIAAIIPAAMKLAVAMCATGLSSHCVIALGSFTAHPLGAAYSPFAANDESMTRQLNLQYAYTRVASPEACCRDGSKRLLGIIQYDQNNHMNEYCLQLRLAIALAI